MKLSYIIIAVFSFSLVACGGHESNTDHGHDHGDGTHEHEAYEDHTQEEFIVNDSLIKKHNEEETEQPHEGHDDHQHPHNH